ncbi:hypothetical protein J2T17_007111 [Paenibacillus mucilaginosus]|uniref:stalk domain-containing protein n=1 Tax=Paenibacillus mucilaginosus TaxID=61624 RepID=UPI003D1C4C1E
MKSKKLLAICVSGVFAMGISTGVMAETVLKEVTAYLNSEIKMKINGKPFLPVNEDGQQLSPLIYEGSSYLPVRALGEAFGKSVAWDESTKVIRFDDAKSSSATPAPATAVGLFDLQTSAPPNTVLSKDPESLSIHNKRVTEGFYATDLSYAFYSGVHFKTNKKYSKLSFDVAIVGDPVVIKVNDYQTKVEYKKSTVAESDQFVHIEVPTISTVDGLNLHGYTVDPQGKASKMVVTNIRFEP